MTTLVYPNTLVPGAAENVSDLNANLNAIAAVVNGNIDGTNNIANAGVTANNLSTALAQMLGVTNVANTGRGKTIIATAESRTNTAYGTLTTADQVTGIVLPTAGLIFVAYMAMWQESVDGAARAAIFVGANQLKIAGGSSAAPFVQEARNPGGAGINKPLSTGPQGLEGALSASATAYTGHVTTGQAVGVLDEGGTLDGTVGFGFGPCTIFAAAGTYTISVQYKASSGSVTASNRNLWVWTQSFG